MMRSFLPVFNATRRWFFSRSGLAKCVAQGERKNDLFYYQHGPCFQRQNFGTTPLSISKGEECYQNALEALKQAELEKQEQEKQKSVQQYEAWERAQQRNPVSGGVAITKTIAKQTRRAREDDEQKNKYWTEKAQVLLEEAAFQHHHAKALVMLGNESLERGRTETSHDLVEVKVLQAMKLYRMAGEEGSSEGWFNLGQLLWTGYPNQDDVNLSGNSVIVRQDKPEAMSTFIRAVELGDSDAMYFVGVHNLSDERGDNESTEAIKARFQSGLRSIENAADLSHPGALYYLALFLYKGCTVLNIPACSAQEFCERLDTAADAGDAEALFLRGHSYFYGEDGRAQNYQKAFNDFLRASDAEHADAAVSAGAMLHQGTGGVMKDQRYAFDLYQRAAELGSMDGWRNVVACYALGEGVPQCLQTAEYITKTMLQDDKS